MATPPFGNILGVMSGLFLGTLLSNFKSVALTVFENQHLTPIDRPLSTHTQTDRHGIRTKAHTDKSPQGQVRSPHFMYERVDKPWRPGNGLISILKVFRRCRSSSRVILRKQESRAVARKPSDAAAVLFGLKFADNIHYKFKSSQASKARLHSSKHTGTKQNLRQNGDSRSFKVTCFGYMWKGDKAIRNTI